MKAAQKRRLLSKTKDGEFINNDNFEVLRHRSIISESTITGTKASYKETGIIWIEDEAETKKWLASKQPKKKTIVKKNNQNEK